MAVDLKQAPAEQLHTFLIQNHVILLSKFTHFSLWKIVKMMHGHYVQLHQCTCRTASCFLFWYKNHVLSFVLFFFFLEKRIHLQEYYIASMSNTQEDNLQNVCDCTSASAEQLHIFYFGTKIMFCLFYFFFFFLEKRIHCSLWKIICKNITLLVCQILKKITCKMCSSICRHHLCVCVSKWTDKRTWILARRSSGRISRSSL